MSKAFTSEETEDASIAGRIPSRAAPGEERPITPEGHRALEHTLGRLEQERRDADDDDTRKTLDHHVALVKATLESVRVVEQSAHDGTVRFGCTVDLVWGDSDREERVRIVGPDEVTNAPGQVSVVSPLGRALLGRRAGEDIELERPKGTVEVRISRVS